MLARQRSGDRELVAAVRFFAGSAGFGRQFERPGWAGSGFSMEFQMAKTDYSIILARSESLIEVLTNSS